MPWRKRRRRWRLTRATPTSPPGSTPPALPPPIMGEIATRLADIVIVTDDNPRSEDPAAIRAAVLKGCPEAEEIADRSAAIRRPTTVQLKLRPPVHKNNGMAWQWSA